MGLAKCKPKPDQTFMCCFGATPIRPPIPLIQTFPGIFRESPAPEESSLHRQRTRRAGRRTRLWLNGLRVHDNRLTARVMANRVWQFHFGRGIVRSSNNFGKVGGPTHAPRVPARLAGSAVDRQ